MEEKALFYISQGVYILGSKDGDRFVGSTIDAVMQTSLKPIGMAISCLNTSYTKSCIEKTKEFSISVLSTKANPYIVANFGFQSSKNINKWENIKHNTYEGLPYVEDCISVIICKVIDTKVFESHTMFIAEIKDAKIIAENEPLTYLNYRTSFKNEVFKYLPEIMKVKENKNG